MLLSGCLPFDPLHIEQVTENSYFPMTGIGWDNISNEAKDLVKKLLAKDPKKRICVRDILLHPWLVNDVPDEDLGVDYFARLKHLVLCQKLKGFFKDCNIKQVWIHCYLHHLRPISMTMNCRTVKSDGAN